MPNMGYGIKYFFFNGFNKINSFLFGTIVCNNNLKVLILLKPVILMPIMGYGIKYFFFNGFNTINSFLFGTIVCNNNLKVLIRLIVISMQHFGQPFWRIIGTNYYRNSNIAH